MSRTQTAGPGTAPGNATSATPTLRVAGRRALFWVVAGVGAVLVAVAGTLIADGAAAGGPALAADNPAPAGSMALVEVLRRHGVTVTPAHTLVEARAAAGKAANPTVFFYDENAYLTAAQVGEMARLAPRTVVAAPDFLTLHTLAPEVGFGGVAGNGAPAAGCTVPSAAKAGRLSPGGNTLRLTRTDGAGGSALVGCFPGSKGRFGLVERTAARTLTLVPDTAVFRNDTIAGWGNAALALNLLGESDTLVWYLPTIADVARTGPPSIGALTPGWVTPSLVLLVLVALAAFIWRGRRFGPLVAENLPVTVRASETMEGRARLYARGNARLRAVDALRVGTVQRLARRLGLPRTAGVDEVVLAVAVITNRPPGGVRAVLVDDVPAGDGDLIRLSDQLLDLERATTRATAPQPHGRMDT